MNCPYCIKVCTKCGKILVAYSSNFKKKKNGKYGLASRCKKCDKQYREEHKEEIAEYKKQYYEEHKEEILEKSKEYREEHKEEKAEYDRKYYEEHKEEKAEYIKQYYIDNKEKILEKNKQYNEEHKKEIAEYQAEYYINNKEEILEQHKKYREEHKEEIAERSKQYYRKNPHIFFNARNKRRQLEKEQGNGITKEQWLEMMIWFDWCCAYSGEYIGGKDNKDRHIDHIIPISIGGLNECWNCVPMFSSYNISKKDKDMLDWYAKQSFYSEERLERIYEWCEYAYEKWGYEI